MHRGEEDGLAVYDESSRDTRMYSKSAHHMYKRGVYQFRYQPWLIGTRLKCLWYTRGAGGVLRDEDCVRPKGRVRTQRFQGSRRLAAAFDIVKTKHIFRFTFVTVLRWRTYF